MFLQFKEIITKFQNIPDEILHEIFQSTEQFQFKKNEVILQENQVCRYIYFIIDGCARSYYHTKNGTEKTRLIAQENDILTVLNSFLLKKPSLENLQALENASLLGISHQQFYLFLNKYQDWEIFYRKMLEQAFFFQNRKIENLITLSASDRFSLILKERPELLSRVSNKVLSSYIDVREETLSRLKSKV